MRTTIFDMMITYKDSVWNPALFAAVRKESDAWYEATSSKNRMAVAHMSVTLTDDPAYLLERFTNEYMTFWKGEEPILFSKMITRWFLRDVRCAMTVDIDLRNHIRLLIAADKDFEWCLQCSDNDIEELRNRDDRFKRFKKMFPLCQHRKPPITEVQS